MKAYFCNRCKKPIEDWEKYKLKIKTPDWETWHPTIHLCNECVNNLFRFLKTDLEDIE